MKRKPQILNRDGSVYAILGETAHIRCTGEMIPNHGSVSWRRKGYRVGTDPDPFEVLDEKFGTEFVSTLVIPAVQQQDFGTYECFVENEIGRDGAIFHLREEGELTLASIIGSILGLIFTLIILAAAAYWRTIFTTTKSIVDPHPQYL
ncbi:peroxidasin-like [Eurytemora carolleeae]|uniref:peroxidasin-like n=1 Tax=Eurytemora carolleeae TaxID=1294199 RepID=UPI000C75F112|nr:peroxidasin-like [Eurytemora carolleeae]|eukprot:XP_023346799.1 peroxidasin-like [Eurytemora affinis]